MGIVSKWNNHGIFLLKSENQRRLINLTPHHLNDTMDDYLVEFPEKFNRCQILPDPQTSLPPQKKTHLPRAIYGFPI